MNEYFCTVCYQYTNEPHQHTYQEILKKAREQRREEERIRNLYMIR